MLHQFVNALESRIHLSSSPVARFDETQFSSQAYRFSAGFSKPSSQQTIVKCLWRFGDGTRSYGMVASHTYTLAGTFPVRLTVTDSAGKSASVSGSVVTGNADSASISGIVYLASNFDGAVKKGSYNRKVWLDTNANARIDAGEPTTLTDIRGEYVFPNLKPGTYHVRQEIESGYLQLRPARDWTINITGGEAVAARNFTSVHGAIIVGNVQVDENGDGEIEYPESGAIRTVWLDSNSNGKRDRGERSIQSDFSGRFQFDGLYPGTYNVRVSASPGESQTDPISGAARSVTIVKSNVVNAGDFIFAPSSSASISGRVFFDANDDGLFEEETEHGLSGQTVFLDENRNGYDSVDRKAVTDSDGTYQFVGLRADTHQIGTIVPRGYRSPTNPYAGYQLSRGEHYAGLNFGITSNSRIGGRVFRDGNGDGVFSPLIDGGIRPADIYLDVNNNGHKDSSDLLPEPLLSSIGLNWAILVPNPGTYIVRFAPPTGQKMQTPSNGRLLVTVGAAEVKEGLDFITQKA